MNGDRELLEAAAGDKEAGALLLERNTRLVWFAVHRFMGFARKHNLESPCWDDLFQHACLVFLTQLKNYKTAGFDVTLSTFMCCRLFYCLRKYRDKLYKTPVVSLDAEAGGRRAGGLRFIDTLGSAFDDGAAAGRLDLQRALDALSADERELLRERYWRGRTQVECAALFNISQALVSRKELRALSRLRGLLEAGARAPALESLNVLNCFSKNSGPEKERPRSPHLTRRVNGLLPCINSLLPSIKLKNTL
jgi:RNA polymerase sigma factor (sigma-70 family)